MQRKSVGALFTILGLILWASVAVATPAGTIIGIRGSCTDNGHVLNRGDAVQVGDTLEVAAGGNLKLQMADGSVISVASGSRMTVASYESAGSGRDAKLLLAHGVLRVTSATRPFEVSTAIGTASVASDSADWFVESQADAGRVGVLAGVIDFTSKLIGESVSIPTHWGTRLEAGRAPKPPRVWSQMEFNGFIRLTQ